MPIRSNVGIEMYRVKYYTVMLTSGDLKCGDFFCFISNHFFSSPEGGHYIQV